VQVPLLFLTDYIKKRANSNQIGNYVFWFTFVIFGQPMAIMLYYHDWSQTHPNLENPV
jgi:diacylglycerol O-acyltransferase-1